MSVDQDVRLASLRRGYRKQHNLDKSRAVWGDAFGVVADPNRPGKVYVRVMTSNGLSVARSVWAPRIPFGVQVGDPVKLKYEDGRLMVDGPDHAAMLSVGTNPVARAQVQGSGSSTPQGSVETLRLVAKTGLLLGLKGWNAIANNHFHGISFPDIDMTGHVPSAGQMRYVGIFVKSDFTDTQVVNGTARSAVDLPLGDADIDELLAAATFGYTPAWAIKLIGGQTSVTQAEIDSPLPGGTQDLRQLVNARDSHVQVAVRVVTAAGAVTVTTSDYLVCINKTVGAATICNLPASPSTGDAYVIKDKKGDAAANNITVTPAAGNIDGAGTYVMNVNRQSVTAIYDGSEWSIN